VTVALGSDLGSQLRAGRLRLGLSQRDLAGRVNVSSNWISMLEAGRRGLTEDLGKRIVYELELTGSLADELLVRSAGRRTVAPMRQQVVLRCRGVTGEDLEAAGMAVVLRWMAGHHASTCKGRWIGSEAVAAGLRSRRDDTFVCMPCQSEAGKLKGVEKVCASLGARSPRSWADVRSLYGQLLRSTKPSASELVASRSGRQGAWILTPRRVARRWQQWLDAGLELGRCEYCGQLTFTMGFEKRSTDGYGRSTTFARARAVPKGGAVVLDLSRVIAIGPCAISSEARLWARSRQPTAYVMNGRSATPSAICVP